MTVIDYSIKWPVAKIISKANAIALADFIVNDLYDNYKALKKIIIDRGFNLWVAAMKKTFELLSIKHRSTTSYYFRTNDAVKKFNDVLNQMLTKYCIEQLIKNWNIYLSQALFVCRIRTYTTTEFSFFYLLYDVNSKLFDDANNSTSDLYDERIDFVSFLNKNRAAAFQKTMKKVKKNKAVWNVKIKEKTFKFDDMILIRTKKSKKFESNWYDSYKVIRSEILNIYIVKLFEKFLNSYLINENRIKLTYVEKDDTIKSWRLSRDRERSRKTIKDTETKKKWKTCFKNRILSCLFRRFWKRFKSTNMRPLKKKKSWWVLWNSYEMISHKKLLFFCHFFYLVVVIERKMSNFLVMFWFFLLQKVIFFENSEHYNFFKFSYKMKIWWDRFS